MQMLHEAVASAVSPASPQVGNQRPCSSQRNPEQAFLLQRLCKEERLNEVLDVLVGLDQQASVQMYVSLLQVCIRRKALDEAKQLHSHLAKYGLESNSVVGEWVVNTLVKCGSLVDGLLVFGRLSSRTAFSWTAILTGLCKAGKCRDALRWYVQMLQEGVQPNSNIFVSLIQVCGKLGDLEEGRRIHADVIRYECDCNVFVGTTLINMYSKCGSIDDARQVFDGLASRNVVSWNAMLAAYAQHDQVEQTLLLYDQMLEDGMDPNERTFVSVLQACASMAEREESILVGELSIKLESLAIGKALHAEAARLGYAADVFAGSNLVCLYSKCGNFTDARYVFNHLPRRNVVAWNVMLASFSLHDQEESALQLYGQMEEEGVTPSSRTLIVALQACIALAAKEEGMLENSYPIKVGSLQKGKILHADAARRDYHSDVFVGSTLVNLYSKCGSLVDSQLVFDKLPNRDVVAWTGILAAYAQQEHGEKALQLFSQMQEVGVTPNAWTFVSAVQACGSLAEKEGESVLVDGQSIKLESLHKGRALHSEAASRGYGSNVFVGNTLISMYAKCGSMVDAELVFVGLPQRSVVSFNAMLAAYAEQEQGVKALELYEKMKASGLKANDVTFRFILAACSKIGALNNCFQIHRDIVDGGFELDPAVVTSLIHAYGKCGSMSDAQRVFDSMSQHTLHSWTAMIAGYARQGQYERSIRCYEQMSLSGLKPNGITFLSVLTACSHAGLVDEGLKYFNCMTSYHGIPAEIEHYACLIDLLGRAGLLGQAEKLLLGMPMEPTLPIWISLLGACRKHGNVEMGRWAFDCAAQLQPRCGAAYLLMSNIYAQAGMWDYANDIAEMELGAGAWNYKPAKSWVEVNENIHTFTTGPDLLHPELLDLLEELSSDLGTAG